MRSVYSRARRGRLAAIDHRPLRSQLALDPQEMRVLEPLLEEPSQPQFRLVLVKQLE